jgi:hypothetical protein
MMTVDSDPGDEQSQEFLLGGETHTRGASCWCCARCMRCGQPAHFTILGPLVVMCEGPCVREQIDQLVCVPPRR